MLPAVRGASSPRVPVGVVGGPRRIRLKLSSRFIDSGIRGGSLAAQTYPYLQQRVLTTKWRCDRLFTSISPVVAPTTSTRTWRPSLAPAPVSMGPSAAVQARSHAGRSHHHHHHHDNTYLTSTNKHDAGVRITRIGLYVNLGMAISKGVGGYVFQSQALTADAVHSLTDLVSDFLTLATVSFALRKPTERFPLGYGKFESLGSLGVSSLLLVGGLLMGMSSALELCHIYLPAVAHFLDMVGLGHGHSHSQQIPNIQAAWIAGGSVLVKEWLYRATMKVANERKSSVLASNAVHHRVDSLTGIAALLSITVSNVFPTFAGMDSVGGLLISWLVIRAGWGNTYTSLVELADAGVDTEVKDKAQQAAIKALDILGQSDVQVRKVQGIKAGQSYLLELELAVPAHFTVTQTRDIEEAVRTRLGEKVRGVKRVRIRFVPLEVVEDLEEEFLSPSVTVRSTPEPENHHEHVHGNGSGVDEHINGNHVTKRR